MNHFEYNIYETVYNDIISGKKTIEYRLLNDKSNSINTCDEIKFKVLNNEDKYILVEVTNKYIYNNLEELWNDNKTKNNILGYTKEKYIEEFYNIFGREKVDNSKIVGIEFIIKDGE